MNSKEDKQSVVDDYGYVLVGLKAGEDGEPPIIVYGYTQTRAKYNAEAFLKGFKGYLETDGYQGYNSLPGIKRCCCWSHVRRGFVDAIPGNVCHVRQMLGRWLLIRQLNHRRSRLLRSLGMSGLRCFPDTAARIRPRCTRGR